MSGSFDQRTAWSRDPGEDDVSPWIAPLLSIFARVFGAGVLLHAAAYRVGLLAIRRASRPVVSVGNLAVGGTGKTPFVILLAGILEARGVRVAVLSRGYGRRPGPREPLIVSRGSGAVERADVAGDEPVLIAARTRASVVVAKRRAEAARTAVEELGAEVLILDDGFQHRALARDLDIVVLDGARPFGNGALLPRGPLRERPKALERASLLVVNHGPVPRDRLREGFEPSLLCMDGDLEARPHVSVGVVATSVGGILGGDRAPAASLSGRRVALLAGIARPERFEASVRGLGASVVSRLFLQDHADIGSTEIDRFRHAAREARADILLTTEKDAVRIAPDLAPGIETLAVEHRVMSGGDVLERALAPILVDARAGQEGAGRA